MNTPSEEQIKLFLGGQYSFQSELNNRSEIFPTAYEAEIAAPNAQFLLLNASMFAHASTLSVGSSSATVGGVVSAALAGAVGTASLASLSGPLGHLLNLVTLLAADSDDALTDNDGRQVYGLIQKSAAAVDGAAIGAAAAENLQVSFVTYIGGTLALTTVDEAFRLHTNVRYRSRDRAPDVMMGRPVLTDVLVPVPAAEIINIELGYTITTAPSANPTINLANSNGSIDQDGAMTGDASNTPVLGASATTEPFGSFATDERWQVYRNGVKLQKGVDVTYAAGNNVTLNFIPKVGERIQVRARGQYT